MQNSCEVLFVKTLIGLGLLLLLTGCAGMMNWHFKKSLDPVQGELTIAGIMEPVTIRRDVFGIPFIEAKNQDDLAFAIGYVNASDRLAQMTGFKLMSQGKSQKRSTAGKTQAGASRPGRLWSCLRVMTGT